ncbi:MAG: tetratricopeptide repeat protein [Candidatus Korobacteraceae bacterium]
MRYGRWLAPVIASLLITTAQAQLHVGGSGGPNSSGNIHVRVLLENGRNAGPYLQVRLLGGGSSTIGTTYTNDIGEASFNGIPVGSYSIEVSGDGIQTKSTDSFEVDERKISQSEWITVHRLEESGPKPVSAHSTMVSANDLNVPVKARKELDKANEEMAMQNWKKALEHLNKAIALAPQYATAYNNLGVFYAKTNDIPHEEEALKKAVSLDEHFAPALLNYGKLCMKQKNFPQAEELLRKASTVEPNNPETLTLLADAEFMDRHFDAAIASAHQAHSSGQDHPSFVHYIAARAYQQKNQQAEALAEFQLFLQEEPKGPRADYVRGDVAKMQRTSASQPVSPQ